MMGDRSVWEEGRVVDAQAGYGPSGVREWPEAWSRQPWPVQVGLEATDSVMRFFA